MAVRIIKEMETAILFGEYGTQVEEILEFASGLDLDTARQLGECRTDAANTLTSEGYHRWMRKSQIEDRHPNRDLTWLKQPWSDASSALLETAWGLGVPDLFDETELTILLQAWHRR